MVSVPCRAPPDEDLEERHPALVAERNVIFQIKSRNDFS